MRNTIMAMAPGGIKGTMGARLRPTPRDMDLVRGILRQGINLVRAIPRQDINPVLVRRDRLDINPVRVMGGLPRDTSLVLAHPVMGLGR